MQTGEGKTLAAVMPAALQALGGDGVHVLTFNDYLACRDAEWMGPVYRMLGLSVDAVQQGMPPADRRRAYRADVTYVTARRPASTTCATCGRRTRTRSFTGPSTWRWSTKRTRC